MEDVTKQEREEGTYRRGELPWRFIARKLFRWSDKRYDQEYWKGIGNNRRAKDLREEEQ